MRKNRHMDPLYRAVKSKNLDSPARMNKKLRNLVDSGFVRANGCVLLASQEQLTKNVRIEDFPDRTGYECFVNHVHVEEYLDQGTPQLSCLGHGLAFANYLKEKLSSLMSENFRLVISSDELCCSVRFHVIRNGEEWLDNDLDNYKHEAILTIDT